MAKILVLAKSGFGKTTSWCGREKLGIKGLDPNETFVIQCISRAVPNPNYKLTPQIEIDTVKHSIKNIQDLGKGNRVQVDHITGIDRFHVVADLIEMLKKSKFRNIVVDDFNYLSQDFYMANAMKGGWDTPKQIGYGMGLVFNAMKGYPEDKNIFCCAHYEEYKDKNGDSISYKFKTTGKMVDDYITPEGNFDVILYGKQTYNTEEKKPVKEFVYDYDGEFPAKDSIGLFDSLSGNSIPNDLSIVSDRTKEIYG